MTPAQLLAQCDDQIALAGPDTIVTVVLRGRKTKSDMVRLLGRRGPVGRVYSDHGGDLVVGFKAQAVKDFITEELTRAT